MRYRVKKGIVLTSVCGQYILVAAKKTRENCPYITQINETTASCWRLLENGCTCDGLIRFLLDEYDAEDENLVKEDVEKLLAKLFELGYIIKEDEEEEDEKDS